MNNSFMPGINNFNFPLPQFGMNMGNPNVIYESLSGFQAVKEFQIPAGKVGLLFDNNTQEFYWKDVDSHGMQTLKRFRYEEIPLPVDSSKIAESNQIEIQNLNQRIAGMETMFSQFLQKMENQKTENPKENQQGKGRDK